MRPFITRIRDRRRGSYSLSSPTRRAGDRGEPRERRYPWSPDEQLARWKAKRGDGERR